ncbi:MAG: hypothetical protein V1887_01185 [Candidatus Aenigmatarchaeota archaeon]
MRVRVWGPGDTISVKTAYEKAKELIEKHGRSEYGLETHYRAMDGFVLVVTSRNEIDKDKGFRGFFTYEQVCESLDKLRNIERKSPC